MNDPTPLGPELATGLAPGLPVGDLGGLELTFHHVGVACRDLDRETGPLLAMGYRVEGDDFIDPVQGVRGRFLGGQSPRLELLTPLPGSAVLEPWLKARVKFYHLAYETPTLEAAVSRAIAGNAKLVVGPVRSVAFEGRRIAFVMLQNMIMVEFIGP
jgi:methylmalonyl-CoA/ethylmalonyl-CoA epimerase